MDIEFYILEDYAVITDVSVIWNKLKLNFERLFS